MDEISERFANYLEYLDEIRRRIFSLVLFFTIFFLIGFLAAAPILKQVIGLIKIPNVSIVITSPFQFIDLAMSVGLFAALIFCLPLVIYHIYAFLKDILSSREKKFFFVLLPVSLALFIIGFAYGFFILYFALGLIASVNISLGVVNLWDINQFLSQIILTAALLGLIFEFPIILTFLIRIGLINRKYLKKNRRYAYAAIFILVALLPPTDGLSLIVMSVPLVFIYEGTIIANFFINHKPKKKHQREIIPAPPGYLEQLIDEYEGKNKEEGKEEIGKISETRESQVDTSVESKNN
jgi:sec-independent protein translocase protein TatC